MIFTGANRLRYPFAPRVWATGVLAGLAGGGAEVAWIILYGRLSDGEAAAVARGVTDSFSPHLAASSLAVPLGVAIHMGLAILFGLAIAVLMRSLLGRMRATALEPVAVIGMLVDGSSDYATAFAQAENALIFYGREGLDFGGTQVIAYQVVGPDD